jgi:site-specific recombinase XerD
MKGKRVAKRVDSQQARKKLGLRRSRKERRLPQPLAESDLKRFFRAIQPCGEVQHEILLKLLFYTAVRVSELYASKSATSISTPARSSSIAAREPRTLTSCFRRAFV